MKTHDGPHGGANYDENCYGCKLKAKNLTLSSTATPTRGRHQPFRPMVQPSWEAGTSGETRRDGYFHAVFGQFVAAYWGQRDG